MNSVLEKAKAHYKNALSAAPQKIEIPEWDTVAYVKPKLSLEKTGEILDLSSRGKTAEAMALTVIYRLVNEDGEPLFRPPEKVILMKQVDPDVLAQIINKINDSLPTAEDVAGN